MVDNKKPDSTPSPANKNASKGSDKEKEKSEKDKKDQALELSFLEADDDFEEFPTEEWKQSSSAEVLDETIWEDNWDDDNIEEDFAKQLK